MRTYFQDVGGSQILNTTTQYPGNNGTPADTSTYVDSVVDTTAFPHTGADVAHAVTQSDINTEVFNQINANSWPLGLSDMYFVFLPGQPRGLRQRARELQHERVLRLPHVRLAAGRTRRPTTSSGPTSRSTAASTRPAAAATRT